jgi:antitoxin ParD1/3/4
MTTLNISLPEPMRAFVDEQVAQGGYSTASEYMHQLIRADQKRLADKRLETLLLEGVRSGNAVQISDTWWEQKKADLQARLQPDKNP